MSISGTLSSALSGLNVASRAMEVVATNIANANTPGYARRVLQVGANMVGNSSQGVEVVGVIRITDRALMSDRRISEAGAAEQQTMSKFLAKVETAMGSPTDAASLGGRIGSLDAALIAAASRPESEARLADVLASAKGLATQIGTVARSVQDARARADADIFASVNLLNETLAQVAEMNGQIRNEVGSGRDASTLMDQRQALVDKISAIVPVRENLRKDGQIALITTGGAVLLEGRPAVFGFDPTGVISPDMTVEVDALSGLTLNERPIASLGAATPISGGSLAGNFAIRDVLAPEAQARLDGLARDLIARFADAGVDPTVPVGQPGLFTDAGDLVDPAQENGLAQRLAVNAAVDPARGGALWRLRDGIGATAPGPGGQSALLTALNAALNQQREPVSGGFMAGQRSFSALAGDLFSRVSTDRLAADTDASFAAAKSDALRRLELEMGVDTDAEMQQLLVIEQAYAANARIVKTVDDMVKLLLGM
jgi:flagellar hook-associated protein 1 FlgK